VYLPPEDAMTSSDASSDANKPTPAESDDPLARVLDEGPLPGLPTDEEEAEEEREERERATEDRREGRRAAEPPGIFDPAEELNRYKDQH
jgi:hypothetical protein